VESPASDADEPPGEPESPPGEPETLPSAPAASPRGRSASVRRPSVRAARLWAVLVLLVAGAVAVSSLGPVRTVLRQSFTDETKPNVDFYFTGDPYVSGEWIQVPLGVLNAPQSGAYPVHLWTVDAAGKVESTATSTLRYTAGRGSVNVDVLQRGDGEIVVAQLVGTTLTVHFRYEGSPLGSAFPSASATK
jgi:hypothetical protein